MKIAPLLVTSAALPVAPFVDMNKTADRIAHTIESIRKWLIKYKNLQIVICDGSGYDFNNALRVAKIENSDNVEILSFKNNEEMVKIRGKGYGEGEIVSYALNNSWLLRNNNTFAKCTGKLYVDNFIKCIGNKPHSIQIEKFYNSRYSTIYNMCDTRFYVANVDYYEKFLADCHLEVDDFNGYYLEHAFAKKIKESQIKKSDFKIKPIISGYAGSSGLYNYSSSESLKRVIFRRMRRLYC